MLEAMLTGACIAFFIWMIGLIVVGTIGLIISEIAHNRLMRNWRRMHEEDPECREWSRQARQRLSEHETDAEKRWRHAGKAVASWLR
jgi:hypothetical protein